MPNLLDTFGKIFKPKGDSNSVTISESLDYSPTIRVVGPRASGKTVYLAALARWPNADFATSPVQDVIAINNEGERLIEKAKNLLEKGEELMATGSEGLDIDKVQDYAIQITLKQKFGWRNTQKNSSEIIKLNINCKDYPGEFFEDILYQNGSPLLQDYLNDCLQAEGILLLIDGMGYLSDNAFAQGLEQFLVRLDRQSNDFGTRRIALVITKCEQSQLWVNRDNPEKIMRARFKEVYRLLQSWSSSNPGSVEYFTASAFGMVGVKFPEPNMEYRKKTKSGIHAVLKYPERWKPFGLVSPIYWLCTGRHNELLITE